MNSPLVSILMPAHHSESFIARSVNSVLAQTHANWELLIIADDGKDYAPALEKAHIRDQRIRLLSSGGISTGPAHARNVGLDAARGELIATLDSDDIFHPVRLEVLVPAAMKHGYAFSTIEMRRDLGHGMAQVTYLPDYILPGNVLTLNDHLPMSFYSTGGVFHHHRVPIRWREDLDVNEDVIFAMQAYDYIRASYFASVPLYIYFRRNRSHSTHPQFFERVIPEKQAILTKIRQGTIGITSKEALRELEKYLNVSLALEEELVLKGDYNPEFDFIALLQERWKKFC